MRRDRRLLVHGEVHTIAAARDAQVADLREEVDVALVRHAQESGVVAIADRARVAQVQPGKILGDVRDDDARRAVTRVEERHPDERSFAVPRGHRVQRRVRLIEVEGERLRSWRDVGAWPLGDPQQQDDLVADPGHRSVEDRNDLELGHRRLHVRRREERVLDEPAPEIHALCARAAAVSLEEAAAFGNLIASITVQQIGVTGTATPGEVRERWREVREGV